MAWIESHQKLENSGKLIKLALMLRINKYQAIGHLHCLWWWALDNAKDGDLKRFGNAVVTQACGWSAYVSQMKIEHADQDCFLFPEEEEMIPALIECEFITNGNGLHIKNWEEYTHRYMQSVRNNEVMKEKSRERVRKYRNASVTLMKRLCNAGVTPMKRHVTRSTIPNHTKPNQTKETSLFSFDLVWSKYPNKDGRKSAEAHFHASVLTEQDFQDINTALNNYLKSEKVQKGFVKNGSTWFNNWRDWVEVTPVMAGITPEKQAIDAKVKYQEFMKQVERRYQNNEINLQEKEKIIKEWKA